MRVSKKKHSTGRRRSTKRTIRRSSRVGRSLGKLGRMADTHHFKETVNAGVLYINPLTGGPAGGNIFTGIGAFAGTGVYAMQLSDFPIFQRFNGCFEFARLNRCTIEFIPKYNMQLSSNSLSSTASTFSASTSGTFITAVDQVPFIVVPGTTSVALNWVNDSSNSSGTTSATPYTSTTVTPGYVRGLQGSREKELYKKHTLNFYPAFYDYLMTGISNSGSITANASYQRKIKAWVSTQTLLTTGTAPVATNTGPLYFGPVYALDVNGYPGGVSDNINIPLFDVRLKYSMSFKRLRGV